MVLAFTGMAARRQGDGAMIALAIFAPVTGLILHLAASRSRELLLCPLWSNSGARALPQIRGMQTPGHGEELRLLGQLPTFASGMADANSNTQHMIDALNVRSPRFRGNAPLFLRP